MIGVSSSEFWDMTPRWFVAKVRAHEQRLKYAFERDRAMTYLLCAYSGHMRKGLHPDRFWPSPWEKKSKTVWGPIDPAVLANFDRNADDVLAQMKSKKDAVN